MGQGSIHKKTSYIVTRGPVRLQFEEVKTKSPYNDGALSVAHFENIEFALALFSAYCFPSKVVVFNSLMLSIEEKWVFFQSNQENSHE